MREAAPLWRNVSFQLTWSSTAASGFGDRMIQLAALAILLRAAMSVTVEGSAGNVPGGVSGGASGGASGGSQAAAQQAAIQFFFFLPYFLFSTLAGWAADTVARKWVMFVCDQARGLVLLVAFFLLPAGVVSSALVVPEDRAWQVLAIIFATGFFATFFSPARDAIMPQIVPPVQLQSANAIVLGIATIASLVGFGVGGWIIDRVSVRAGVMVGVLMYLISGWFWPFLRVRRHEALGLGPRPGQIARLVQAAGYLGGHRRIRELVWLGVLFWGVAMLVVAAVAGLCARRYQLPSEQLVSAIAVMQMMIGLGMLASSVFLALFGSVRESHWLALVGLGVCAACVLLLAVNPWYAVGVALCFVMGFFGNILRVTTDTLIQMTTPDYIRGRVFGLKEVLVNVIAVAVNLVIWQMAGLVERMRGIGVLSSGSTLTADDVMIVALYPVSLALIVLAGWGVAVTISAGPMDRALPNILWRITRLLAFSWHRLRVIDDHRVPREGAVILASNHTTGLDPFLIQSGLRRKVRWVMLSSYRFRLAEPVWRAVEPICLDLGGGDLSKIRQIVGVLQRGELVGLFPEGTLQREKRELAKFEEGIAVIARRSGARILPVWIDGTPRKHAMLWHFLWPSRSTVIFGRPYLPDPSADHAAVTADLRQRMLALSERLGGASSGS